MTDKKDPTEPLNEIEYLIAGTRRDLVSVGTLWVTMMRAPLWVMCDREWDGKVADVPLNALTMNAEDGRPAVLAVFTDPMRAEFALTKYPDYPQLNRIPAPMAFFQIGGERGLAVNPGGAFDLTIPPKVVDQLKEVFGPRLPAN